MTRYLDTTGRQSLGIGLCARCHMKFPIDDLKPDRNYPGLMVCDKDNDELDPYRLSPRESENVALPFVRPDEPLS